MSAVCNSVLTVPAFRRLSILEGRLADRRIHLGSYGDVMLGFWDGCVLVLFGAPVCNLTHDPV